MLLRYADQVACAARQTALRSGRAIPPCAQLRKRRAPRFTEDEVVRVAGAATLHRGVAYGITRRERTLRAASGEELRSSDVC